MDEEGSHPSTSGVTCHQEKLVSPHLAPSQPTEQRASKPSFMIRMQSLSARQGLKRRPRITDNLLPSMLPEQAKQA